MAISKTVFRNDSLSAQAPEVLAWLQENGTDYFDDISYDEDNSAIICKINDSDALKLFFTGSTVLTAYLNNGANFSCRRGTSSLMFVYGVTTGKALYIKYFHNTGTAFESYGQLIITKDSENSVTFISLGYNTGSPGYLAFRTASFDKFVINNWYGQITTASLAYESGGYMGQQAAMTALVPFTDKTYEVYTENAFQLPYNQFFGQEGQFTIESQAYYTTGIFALSD